MLLSEVAVNYGVSKRPGTLVKVSANGSVPHAKLHVNVSKSQAKRLGIPHTHLKESIAESSGYSLAGSWTKDLSFSKLWAIRELEKIVGQAVIPTVYVLGSWYGNMSILLTRSDLNIEKIINVDTNTEWLQTGEQMLDKLSADNVESMAKDANKLDYRQLPGVVINTSTNDMENKGWFDNIPSGTLVVLQGRNHVGEKAVYSFDSPDDLLLLYPLNTVLYAGSLELEDPETDYTRSMVIGIK